MKELGRSRAEWTCDPIAVKFHYFCLNGATGLIIAKGGEVEIDGPFHKLRLGALEVVVVVVVVVEAQLSTRTFTATSNVFAVLRS